MQDLNFSLELMSWVVRASSLLKPRGRLTTPDFQLGNPRMIPSWCLCAWSWIKGPAGLRRGTVRLVPSLPLVLRVIISILCFELLIGRQRWWVRAEAERTLMGDAYDSVVEEPLTISCRAYVAWVRAAMSGNGQRARR